MVGSVLMKKTLPCGVVVCRDHFNRHGRGGQSETSIGTPSALDWSGQRINDAVMR